MSEIKLKSCPHCGESVAEVCDVASEEMCGNFESENKCPCYCNSEECGYFFTVCNAQKGGCGASSGWYKSPEEAAAAWNVRAGNE